jgi:hypothetical protein
MKINRDCDGRVISNLGVFVLQRRTDNKQLLRKK